MIPEKMKDNIDGLLHALMGVALKNRYSIIQEVDKDRIISKMYFKEYREIIFNIRTWLISNKKMYDIKNVKFNNDYGRLTILVFDIDGELWEMPLILNTHNESSLYDPNYHEISIWINTHVTRKI